ncbi:hypothetical protein GN956_G3325 [Arapaima gigas]
MGSGDAPLETGTSSTRIIRRSVCAVASHFALSTRFSLLGASGSIQVSMWSRRGGRSSALDRAVAHLQRQRAPPKTDQMPELQEYMDALTKKTHVSEATQSLFQYLGDISSDESEPKRHASNSRPVHDEPAGEGMRSSLASRFLKKASSHQPAGSKPSPALAKMTVGRSTGSGVSQYRSQSTALSRAELIEDRIRSRRQAMAASSLGTGLLAPEEGSKSSGSSTELSMKGSRFLKKIKESVVPQEVPKVTPPPSYTAPQLKFENKGLSLDSDEEDMKKILGDSIHSDKSLLKNGGTVSQDGPVSHKKISIKGKSRSPSPPSHCLEELSYQGSSSYSVRSASVVGSLSPSLSNVLTARSVMSPSHQSSNSVHSDVRSLDELFVDAPRSSDSISEKSTLSDEFKINFMTLDDLAPDVLEKSQTSIAKEPKSTANVVKETRSPLHNAEVAEANEEVIEGEVKPPDTEYESDFESEIKTDNEQNVTDMSEVYRAQNRDWTTGSEDQDSVSERLHPHNLSSHSEGEREILRSELDSIQSGASRYSNSPTSCSQGSYSTTASDIITPPQRKGTPSASGNMRETTTQTQAGGLSYTWSTGVAALGPSVGMSYIDPTPMASHVVSAEAVEALTAYSPAVLALNDMLKQQLALTRQFVESSRHLHNSVLRSLGSADYHYTTLQDAKKFIKSRKPPKLTLEEALEEVLQEMREYHYI